MSESRPAQAIIRLADKKAKKESSRRRTQATGTVTRIESDGTVVVDAGYGDTPASNSSVAVRVGDEVVMTVENESASIVGNFTRPATDDEKANEADGKATLAQGVAETANKTADQALLSAENAVKDAARAHEAAEQAQADAQSAAQDAASAAQSAQSAQEDAATASTAATSAQGSAQTAQQAAQSAQSDAADAASAAQSAQDDATSAASSASQAAQSASTAQQQAQAATTAANEAKADAKTAKDNAAQAVSDAKTAKEQAAAAVSDAATAKQAATDATATANGAVTALATVQGVVDQLETDVDELHVHVAMMDAYDDGHGGTVPAGLHVVPTGSGYFLVIANDGMYVYDNTSVLVTKFGESIDFSSTRPQRIGNDTAYVEFYDSDNDGVPDAIRISGTNLNTAISSVQSALQSKADSSTVETLTTRVSDMEQRVTTNETSIEQTANNVLIKATESDTTNAQGARHLIESLINVAPEGVKISADKVNITGAAVFSAINNDAGTTKINGGKVDADTLHVNAANIDGSLTIGKVDGLQGALDGKASTTAVANAAKRTYVSIVTTALDYEAGTATLEATLYVDGAATTSNVTYEWLRDGSAISGATNRTLNVIAALGLEHAYSCKATYGEIPAETGTIDLKAQVAAAKTASNYIAADATGIRIANANPSTATTYQHQTATNTEFVVDNSSVAEFGADGARVGQNSGSHLALDEHGLRFWGGSGEKRLEVGDVQLTNKRVNDWMTLVPTVGSDGSRTFTLSLPQVRDDGRIAVKFMLARG